MSNDRTLVAWIVLIQAIPAAIAATPTPFIQTLSPPSAAPGTGPLALTIYGANFSASATVSFAGQSFTPDAVSASRVVVTIPAASLLRAGTVDVVVMNPAAGPE